MIKAYQIVDLNNPISVQYMEGSLTAFEPVRDIIEIIPYQCTVPDTIPDGFFTEEIDKHKKTPTEKAIIVTHYNLVKRISEGEQFIVMEHDAYLWPEREDIFRKLIRTCFDYKVWNCGIALEFYTISQRAAITYCSMLERNVNKLGKGPMYYLHHAADRHSGKVIWPQVGQLNLICESESVKNACAGRGKTHQAPVTQYIRKDLGLTNLGRRWKTNEKNNPDILFL